MPPIIELPGLTEALGVAIRLTLAAVLGGILGYERSASGRRRGFGPTCWCRWARRSSSWPRSRPAPPPPTSPGWSRASRPGIGFVGAGAILKQAEGGHFEVTGLTTASTVWITAGVGMAVGFGQLWLPLVATGLGLVILVVLGRYEARMAQRSQSDRR